MLHSDQPIRREGDDLLGRSLFARKLLDSVSAFRSRDNLIVSLCGRWGSGKTSVLNLFRNELVARGELALFEYNPWFFSGERAGGGRFVVDLARAVAAAGGEDDGDPRLLERARRYAAALRPEDEPAGEGVARLKEELDAGFAALPRRVVVLVDDVDRLAPEEIRAFFRLVKLCGDFPNLTYVLAYDDAVVAEALGRPGSVNGHEFLEKIVQVEVRIPTPEGNAIHQAFSVMLQDVFRDYAVELAREDLHRLADVYERLLSRVLVNLRKVKRYLNSLAFHLSILRGEVDTVDFAILEALRIFHPGVYAHLQEHRRHFAGVPDALDAALGGGGGLDEGLLRGVDARARELVRGLVAELSVRHRAELVPQDFPPPFADELRRRRRFASPDYVDKFFILAVPTGEYGDRSLDEAVARVLEAGPRGAEILEKLLVEAAADGRAMSLLRKLDDRVERSAPAFLSSLVEALLGCGERLVCELQATGGMITPATVAARLVRRVLPFLVPLEDPCAILERRIEEGRGLLFAMALFPLRSPLVGEAQQVVTREQESFLARLLVERVERLHPRSSDWIKAFPGAVMRVAVEGHALVGGAPRSRKLLSGFLRSKRFVGALFAAFVDRRPGGADLSGHPHLEAGDFDSRGLAELVDEGRFPALWKRGRDSVTDEALRDAVDRALRPATGRSSPEG